MGVIQVDVSELEAFQARLNALNSGQVKVFLSDALKEIGNQMLNLVKARTPVRSGTLRGGWTVQGGGGLSITIINTVYYASYVEYGHRQTPGRFVPVLGKRLVASWVNGQFFLASAEAELRSLIPGILDSLLSAFLGSVF